DRLEDGVRSYDRATALVCERDGVHLHVPGRTLELEGLNDPVERGLAVEDAVKAELVPGIVDVQESPPAAVAQVVLVDLRAVSARPEPLGEEVRLGERAVDELPGGVELPAREDLRNAGLRDDLEVGHQLLLSVRSVPSSELSDPDGSCCS